MLLAGVASLGALFAIGAVAAAIGYGMIGGITGLDPLGWFEEGSASGCHSSYQGECLDPDASDYDCAGGTGDGPEYAGAVRVVGDDPFGLDADSDGYGCE